jgi:large subunit ribosomal protein L10
MEKKKIVKKVSEKKQKLLSELVDLIKKNRTVMIASIENIPSVQFQRIKKALKGKVILKVIKKNLVAKAFEKEKDLEKLEKKLESNFAILFSELDAFEVASLLAQSKVKSKIKPGQIAEKEIVIEAGVTDIMAGPAISEFTKANIKVGIDQGKIAIKEPFIIKKGDKVLLEIAVVLDKLEIKPLYLSLKPIIAYDAKEKKIYENINVDTDSAINFLSVSARQAYNLALKLNYACKETISYLLSKANMEAMALDKLQIKDESKVLLENNVAKPN